jgi:hypothetical protein
MDLELDIPNDDQKERDQRKKGLSDGINDHITNDESS